MLVAEALRVSRDQRPSMASGRTDATRGWALHCDQPVVRRSARPDSTVCRTAPTWKPWQLACVPTLHTR